MPRRSLLVTTVDIVTTPLGRQTFQDVMYYCITTPYSYHLIYPHLKPTTKYNTHVIELPFKSLPEILPMSAQHIHFTSSLAAGPGHVCHGSHTSDGLMGVILHYILESTLPFLIHV